MRIDRKAKGKFTKLTWTRNKSQDGNTVKAEFTVRVNEEECEKMFGFEFKERVAFAGMAKRASVDADGNADGGEEIVHLIKSPQPSGKMVMEIHRVKVLGRVMEGVQPSVGSLKTVDGEALVDVPIKIPIEIGADDDFDGKLLKAAKTGKDYTVEFAPKQGELPLGQRE